MDMGFIDGSHVYEAVVHDFYAFLEVASESFHLLFDDYVPNENDGVTKAIDEEVAPNFDITLIQTNAKEQRKESGESPDELYICWLDSESLKKPLREIYPKSKSEQIINKYLKWEKRWKLRKNLNSKIPLLNKFKFRS